MVRSRREPRLPGSRRTRRKKKEPYDRVLIVGEGEKTEPYYCQSVCDQYKLSSANVAVISGDGNDPMSVFQTAKGLQRKATRMGEKYDRVFCMFDRDEHTNFDAAVNAVKNEKHFEVCVSYPCFEYWLLCHYKYSRASFVSTGGRTAAACCEHDLKREYPQYEKGSKNVFRDLFPLLSDAINNAERALRDAVSTGDMNPSTQVHELVSYLRDLKRY